MRLVILHRPYGSLHNDGDLQILIYSVHIKAPRAERYHETAEIQFRELSANEGMPGKSAYSWVSSKDLPGFIQISRAITEVITSTLREAQKGNIDNILEQKKIGCFNNRMLERTQSETVQAKEANARTLAKQMVKAAIVDWIGKQSGAKAPRDIVAWATDKDLINPEIQAMEVRLSHE